MGSFIDKILFQPPTELDLSVPGLTYLITKSQRRIYCKFYDNNAPFTLLFSHGNAETLFGAKLWFETCFFPKIPEINVLIYEYTGYTRTNPDYLYDHSLPSESSIYEDVNAAYEYLTNELEIDKKQIILFGRSLGTGPSIDLASREDVAGVILQSAFLSVYRVAMNFRMDICGDRFLNHKKIKNIKCPILLIHGVDDEIVPFEHSVQLHESCRVKYPPIWVRGGGHNDLRSFGKCFYKLIKKFIESLNKNKTIYAKTMESD